MYNQNCLPESFAAKVRVHSNPALMQACGNTVGAKLKVSQSRRFGVGSVPGGWGAFMNEGTRLQIRNDLQEIARMSREVADWCRKEGLPPGVEYQIDLVLDEVVSNVIRHGLKDDHVHLIDVHLRLDGQDLVLEIADDGVPFNPLEAPPPDISKPIEERRIGGLGIHLVREMMDDLSYDRRDGRNCLRIRKRLGIATSPGGEP